MTKNKRLVSRMMLTLIVLTLVSFCCVGFTFARYTSSGEGSATATVAKWAVEFDTEKDLAEGSTTLTLAKLSPNKDPYDATKTRTNNTGAVKVATITNNSEVVAEVTLSTGNISLATIESPTDYDEAKAKAPFSIKFYSDATATAEITTSFDLAVGAYQDIYAVITWQSDNLTIPGEGGAADTTIANGDVNDTMIGQNVTSVSWTITYTAVQKSTQPTA